MSSFDHVKNPLNLNLSIFAKGKVADGLQLTGKALPCTVAKVVSSGIVTVNFEVNAAPFTLPQVTVPIAYSEYVRYPIQVGDKGFVTSADVRLGGITGLGSGTPDLTRPANLSALVFVFLGNTEWSPPTDKQSVEIYGPNGVIIRDKNSTTTITLTPSGITIKLGGDITINSNGHNVNVTGGGDVKAGSISLLHHTHSGVSTGTGNTGPPS
jgi:hypothetical protein